MQEITKIPPDVENFLKNAQYGINIVEQRFNACICQILVN